MRSPSRLNLTNLNLQKLVVATLLAASVAEAADPLLVPGQANRPKPRVFVIFDTSSSMVEAPDNKTSLKAWPSDDTSSDPLNNPVPDAACRSKFCVAKKVVFDVLNGYVSGGASSEVSLALASYYQYLIRYTPNASATSTRCWYDGMWKPGVVLPYPNDATALSSTQRLSSPAAFDLSSANTQVKTLATANGLWSSQYWCTGATAADTTYALNEAATMSTPQSCTVYNQMADPGTLTLSGSVPSAGNCLTGVAFNTSPPGSYVTPDTNGGAFYRYQFPPSVGSCPAQIATATVGPGNISVSPGMSDTVCTGGTTTNCWATPPFPAGMGAGTNCTSSYPCVMYPAAPPAVPMTSGAVEWVGFFAPSQMACTMYTGAACPVGGSNAATFYTPRTEGTLANIASTINGTDATCQGLSTSVGVQTRVTTGSPANYINTGGQPLNTFLNPLIGNPQAGFTRTNPPTPACSGDWPCDVTLTSAPTPGTPLWSTATTVNNCTASPTVQCTAAAPLAVTVPAANAAACPVMSPTPAMLPAGLTPAVICGSGDQTCTFTATGTPAAALSCPAPANTTPITPGGAAGSYYASVWRFDASASTPPASCVGTPGGFTRPYAANGGAVTTNVQNEVTFSTSCAGATVNASFTATSGGAAGATQLNLCRSSTGGCTLNGTGSAPSGNTESVAYNDLTTQPAGWAAGDPGYAVTYPNAGVVQYVPYGTSCANSSGAPFVQGSQLLKFVTGTGTGGTSSIPCASGCPTSGYSCVSSPCTCNTAGKCAISGETALLACAYQPVTRTITRSKKLCQYTITGQEYRADTNYNNCNYNLAKQNKQTQIPTWDCNYSIAARRFDMSPPQFLTCNYWRTQTNLSYTSTTYKYTYASKGGELLGSWYKDVPNVDMTDSTAYPNYASIQAACPLSVDNCLGSGTVCYLRDTAKPAAGVEPVLFYGTTPKAAAPIGRYLNEQGPQTLNLTNLKAGGASPQATGLGVWDFANRKNLGNDPTNSKSSSYLGLSKNVKGGRSCIAADYSAAGPGALTATQDANRFIYLTAKPAGYTASTVYKLVSDYQDCADPANAASCMANAIADINGDTRGDWMSSTGLKPPTGYAALTAADWTAASTKAYGMSGTGPTYSTAAQQLMPFVADTGDNSAAFNQLMSGCTPPVAPQPNWTWCANEGGTCVIPAAPATGRVIYGASGATAPMTANSTLNFPPGTNVPCNNATFTDPASGIAKACWYDPGTVATSNVVWPNWSARGLCMPNTGAPSKPAGSVCNVGGACSDYTPLYGSLQNAYQYIRNVVETDCEHPPCTSSCRKYVVLLATDGAESTPKKYADSDLVSAVTQLRNVVAPSGAKTSVDTYVVGFGDALADPTAANTLNQMAVAGNTNAAYFAADKATLSTNLSQVFASILQGTYSRSKPVLSSDGNNIYASYFDIVGGATATPEQRGYFVAFKINASGTITAKWEAAKKLDEVTTDADRKLFTDVSGATKNFTVTEPSLIGLGSPLTTDPGFPSSAPDFLTAKDVISFVRNSKKTTDALYNTGDLFLGTTGTKRLSRLNAIVRSAPAAVAGSTNAPEWGGSTSTLQGAYHTFQSNVATRESRVYVGASDGILRAFRDDANVTTYPGCSVESSASCPDGTESWGWVPSMLHPLLHNQLKKYQPNLDGLIATEDVCGGDASKCDANDWRTIAIASSRGGARGVFALDVTNPASPKYLWEFSKDKTGDQLGYPTAPIIGRVELNGSDQEKFIAVLGGGSREESHGVYGKLSSANGDEVYVLDAVSGHLVDFYNDSNANKLGNDSPDVLPGHEDNQLVARPSYYRRTQVNPSPYMENAMFSGTGGALHIMRFRKPATLHDNVVSSQAKNNTNEWDPRVFFKPTNAATSKDPSGNEVRVRRVVEDPVGSGTYSMQDCASLTGGATCGKLPLAAGRNLPIYVRPRLAPIVDAAQRKTADYFVGTGDLLIPATPRDEFKNWNYFYAVHDSGDSSNGENDGAPMWVNEFLDKDEQVVSEPALVNGNLVVATYKPSTDPCTAAGDTRLYCFNPMNGDLVNCFVTGNMTNATAPVIKRDGVGIPSDLVSKGDHFYYTTSNPPPNSVTDARDGSGADQCGGAINCGTARPPSMLGATRSYRRLR
jgi:hypothetical protein